MFRNHLEEMSYQDLRKEVSRYGISNIPKSREGCIDALLSHLEKHGPLEEAQATFLDAHGEPDFPKSASSTIPKTSDKNSLSDYSGKETFSECFPQLCSLLVQQISKQIEQMSMLQQMFSSFMSINSDPSRLSHGDLHLRRSFNGDVLPDSRIHPLVNFHLYLQDCSQISFYPDSPILWI